MTKNKQPLQPIIEEHKENKLKKEQIEKIFSELETIREDTGLDSSGFYRELIGHLMNPEDISLKTEYVDVIENFAGVRLEFFSEYAGMPYLKRFLNIFEIKRASLERKSRKEMVMALKEREQEMQEQQREKIKSVFGY